jgi:hypothetical protein
MSETKNTTVFIQVARTDCNAMHDFLKANGVRAQKSFGIMNSAGPMPDPHTLAELAKDGTPYIMASALASVLIAAFNAYAKTHTKKFTIVKNSKGGIKISAENITPKELEEVGAFDLIEFDDNDENSGEISKKPNKTASK